MENYEYLYSASYIIYNIAGLCIVVASIMLFSKWKTTATTLILLGSVLAFIFNISSVFIGVFANQYSTETFLQINAISNIAGGLAYAMFCLGFLLFIANDLKKSIKNWILRLRLCVLISNDTLRKTELVLRIAALLELLVESDCGKPDST